MISFALTRSSSTRACVAATQIQHPLRDSLKDLACALVESGFRGCSYYANKLCGNRQLLRFAIGLP